ncbi:MAG: class I SAM-dependent methyltransferase [Gemmatimonadota bacterium]|nr:MAG: class I SAM-dependent methyltransferase [Gemmatimonadota bacterium]
MDERLARIRHAYDLTVEQYHAGIDPLDLVPTALRNSPELADLLNDAAACNSGAPENRGFLAPRVGMRFLDVGCATGLERHRLYEWDSTYFAVDISPKLIAAMTQFAQTREIPVGGLVVAEVGNLPFGANSFDITAVIGVLEYCAADYVGYALGELHRVVRPDAKVVLDIPNLEHPNVDTMFQLEKCLGREGVRHSRSTFEKQLEPLFSVERCDDEHVMLKYFCRATK